MCYMNTEEEEVGMVLDDETGGYLGLRNERCYLTLLNIHFVCKEIVKHYRAITKNKVQYPYVVSNPHT